MSIDFWVWLLVTIVFINLAIWVRGNLKREKCTICQNNAVYYYTSEEYGMFDVPFCKQCMHNAVYHQRFNKGQDNG